MSELDMTPGSKDWRRLITASKVAAILGVSPWESPRSMWHLMHGDIPPEESNDAQRRGHYLEPAILAWWLDQHPEMLGVLDAQPFYMLGDWAAARPDAVAVNPDEQTRVLVEAKSASSDDDWGQPGTDEIPAYYLVQVQWQMHVSGIHLCYVPVLTSRLRFVEYVVPYYAEYGQQLEDRMKEFYDSLSADEPPELDDTTATYEAIRRIHPDIDADLTVDLDLDTARHLLDAVTELDHAEANERRWKSEVIAAMGKARFATCNGVKVARRQPNKTGISFVPLPKNLPLLDSTEDVA